jgi:hypothetical protein
MKEEGCGMKQNRSLCLFHPSAFILHPSVWAAWLLWLSAWLPSAHGQGRPIIILPVPIAEKPPLADPLPLLRVLVPPQRVPIEMERARKGVLRQMPRDEFEALVQRAASADQARRNPPRLLQARYRATLKEAALEGTADWTVLNPADSAAVLPLQPFNLALLRTQIDGADAILGDLEGKGLGLWVERPGKHSVSLKWTARGDPTPGALRFEIKVPSCVLTSLELDLPGDHTVTVSRDARLLPERLPGVAPGRQLWRLDSAGSGQIDLVIRPERPGHPSPLLLARLQTKQTISLAQIETDYDFVLEAVHGAIAELHCECPPALRPLSVRVRNVDIDTWEFHPGAGVDSMAKLRIQLPELFREGALPLRVHCLSAVPSNQPWTVPELRISGAVSLGETLELHIAPQLRLEVWKPGNFDLIRAALDADGGQLLWLRSGLVKATPPAEGSEDRSRRPSARLKLQPPEIRAQFAGWWQIRPDGDVFSARLNYQVMRGRLFRLSVLLPKDWSVQRVESNPAPLVRSWTVMPHDKERAILLVDLLHPLEPEDSLQWKVNMRPREGASAPTGQGEAVTKSFPEIVPLDALSVSGSLMIGVHPSYHASVQASLPEATPPPATLWRVEAPGIHYAYVGQPVTGIVQIRSTPARVRARCTTEVDFVPGHAQETIRLAVEPDVGFPDGIVLFVSAPVARPWRWTCLETKDVVEMQPLELGEVLPRLLPLGVGGALPAANLLAVPAERGRYWRLRLSEPLRGPVTLKTVVDLDGLGSAADVPLITVLNTRRFEGEVRVHTSNDDAVEIDGRGLSEAPADFAGGASRPVRVFRFTSMPVSLILNGRASGAAAQGRVFDGHLTTQVEPPGRLVHNYRFQIQHWNDPSLRLLLPAEARLLTAKVDGRWIGNLRTITTAEGVVAELPTGSGSQTRQLEVVYETAGAAWQAWARLQAPPPIMPLPVGAIGRTWDLPAGLTPLSDQHFHSRNNGLWTEWEPLPGSALDDAIVVVRRDVVGALAWTLTGAILLASWVAGRRTGRWRFVMPLGWLIIAGLGLLLLPEGVRMLAVGPIAGGALVTTLWVLLPALKPRSAATSKRSGPSVAVASALVLAVIVPGEAAGPETYTVLLLPGSGLGREKQTALVAPELLTELERLARRGQQEMPRAVLLNARYQGSVAAGTAAFDAVFQIHSFADDLAHLSVPLAGVELQEATLDNAPAYPVIETAPQSRFALKVRGRGNHVLHLRFLVRPPLGEDRELRFTIPELAQSHLELTVPAGASHLRTVLGKGAQRITPTTPGTHLDADLGPVSTLHVRWHEEGPRALPTAVQVKEFYYWDFQSMTGRLLGALHYTVNQGAVTTLTVGLPERMEVRRVETGPVAAGSSAPRLKDWLLSGTGSSRQLHLIFQAPVTNQVQVFLELVSRVPIESPAALSLPSPQGAAPTDGLLAYRVEGRQAALLERRDLRTMPVADFLAMWPSGTETPAAPDQAFRFLRPPGGAPALKLHLQSTPAPIAASQGITWIVGEQQASFHAKIGLSAPDESLALVEWEVPAAVALTEVSGPDVRNWSRSGSRVQIWLQRSVTQTTVEVSGWMPRSKEQSPAHFRLPRLYFPGAAQTTFVRLHAQEGLQLHPETLHHLWPLPHSQTSLRDHDYVTEQANYAGVFSIQQAKMQRRQ